MGSSYLAHVSEMNLVVGVKGRILELDMIFFSRQLLLTLSKSLK